MDCKIELSSASDNDSIVPLRLSTSERQAFNNNNDQLSNVTCCLICSVLPVLNNRNCCRNHLVLSTTMFPSALSGHIIFMMPAAVDNNSKVECHRRSDRSKTQRGHRLNCSTPSSSSNSRYRTKNRSITGRTLNTADDEDSLLSSNTESTTSLSNEPLDTSTIRQRHRPNHNQIQISSPIQSSSVIKTTMTNHNLRRQNRILSSPFVSRKRQRNSYRKKMIMQDKSVQANLQQLNHQSTTAERTDASYSPRLLLKRIVQVKDDDETAIPFSSQLTLNMNQAINQMIKQTYTHPRIILQRVCVEQ